MALERKQMDKKNWNVIIVLLFVAIVISAVILVVMLVGGKNDSSNVPREEESSIAVALDENLKFYSPDVEYKVRKAYTIEDEYAVVLLDVAGVDYRALMNHSDGGWKVLGYPKIVFSYEDFPDVSNSVLKKANEVGR